MKRLKKCSSMTVSSELIALQRVQNKGSAGLPPHPQGYYPTEEVNLGTTDARQCATGPSQSQASM